MMRFLLLALLFLTGCACQQDPNCDVLGRTLEAVPHILGLLHP